MWGGELQVSGSSLRIPRLFGHPSTKSSMKNFYDFECVLYQKGASREQLRGLSEVLSDMIRLDDLESLDAIISDIDIDKAYLPSLILVMVISARARGKLPSYGRFVELLRMEFSKHA